MNYKLPCAALVGAFAASTVAAMPITTQPSQLFSGLDFDVTGVRIDLSFLPLEVPGLVDNPDVNLSTLADEIFTAGVLVPNFEITRSGSAVNLASSVTVIRTNDGGEPLGVLIGLSESIAAGDEFSVRYNIYVADSVTLEDLDDVPQNVIPIPAPGSLAIVAAGGIVAARRRR